ncbi:hypothetical protein [Geobacter toluenoxydans]
MRLIKLSVEEFESDLKLDEYFSKELPKRNPPGLFRFTEGRIAEGRIVPGETILFSYRNSLCFITTAKTGRMLNTYMPAIEYPYCVVIDLPPRKVNVPIEDLELMLQEKADFKSL